MHIVSEFRSWKGLEELTLCYGLVEGGENEGHVVARIESVPERARKERCESCAESGFLAYWCDAEVDVVSEPVVGIDIPVADVVVDILCQFNLEGLNVGQTIPCRLSGLWIYASVTDACEDAGSFGECPDTIVLRALSDSEQVELKHSSKEVVLHVLVGQEIVPVVQTAHLEKNEYPSKTGRSLPGGISSTSWNLALLPGWRCFRWICSRW